MTARSALWDAAAILSAVDRGLKSFDARPAESLVDWAERHFYLSAESSYVEQQWRAWPFQRAILACIGNDAIREVDFIKSARVGWTKMLVAAMCYFAAHKRRNQALWQPTDDDRDEFVKVELEPALRDVKVMREALPRMASRDKRSTLKVKRFIGSTLYTRGGKAAKNYRRISVDVAALDEADAFDPDVEGEGDPGYLASKRIEGATFPKFLVGSTPKRRYQSVIEGRTQRATARYRFHIACPQCEVSHPIAWREESMTWGMSWDGDDPSTVHHICPSCAHRLTQAEYLARADAGIWRGDDGTTIDARGDFRDATGHPMSAHPHVAFHAWTALSPSVSWSDIVTEAIEAHARLQIGDAAKIKAFRNTTLGETYEGEVDKTDADDLSHRAEPFALRMVPRGCLLLLAGADTQDNRIEVGVWGYGPGSEMWTIDHQVFYGSPGQDHVWQQVATYLSDTRFAHECGSTLRITATAIDSGGHFTHDVYEFARRHKRLGVYAVRGRPSGEKHIKDGATPVDINWRGQRRKAGVILWHVGTNLAKDLLFGRLDVGSPGPGYMHLSSDLPDEWFKQFAGEVRETRRSLSGAADTHWTRRRSRVEAWDCAVYATWLEVHLELHRKSAQWWRALELRVQPSAFARDVSALASPAREAIGLDSPPVPPGESVPPAPTPPPLSPPLSPPPPQVARRPVRLQSHG